MYTVVNGSTVIVCKLNNVRYCTCMYEHSISFFKFSLSSSELNEQSNVCISVTTAAATESNDNVNIGALAGGVSAGLIFILVITILLVLICTCIPRFRKSKIINSVSMCMCVRVCVSVCVCLCVSVCVSVCSGIARVWQGVAKGTPCLIMPCSLYSMMKPIVCEDRDGSNVV